MHSLDNDSDFAYALPDGEGSQRIEASIILRRSGIDAADLEKVDATDLDKHVRQQLPAYAVPTRIDVLDSFPRTSTGKIHRRKLRERALEAARNGSGLQKERS